MQEPKLITLEEKKFIGKSTIMSLTNNKTFELWKNFMPLRNQIKNSIGTELFSIEVYPSTYFKEFDPATEFQKWAAIEVSNFDLIPDGMETIISPQGTYAAFVHKGLASEGQKTYHYIFQTWLPSSGYIVDNRPHFAIMGEKYKNNDPDSEEELLIPIRQL